MRRLSRSRVSRQLEPIAHLEQVARKVGRCKIDAKALDQATVIPKRAALARTDFGLTLSGEAERAGLGLDLVHDRSVRRTPASGIGRDAD